MEAANSAEKARALEQCERDLDMAIERLVNLRLDAADQHGGGAGAHHDDVHPATAAEEEDEHTTVVGAAHVPSSDGNGIDDAGRAELIERLVFAMAAAGSLDDARACAARLLADFDGAASAACRAERDVALRQNGVLKQAFWVLQQRLCKEAVANRGLQRQLAACQERVRGLETDNYALAMYLRDAQPKPQGGAVTGRFHPEVF